MMYLCFFLLGVSTTLTIQVGVAFAVYKVMIKGLYLALSTAKGGRE